MTLRTAGLAVAVGSPLFALYILGVILLLDLDSPSGQYALAVPVAIFLGFVPWGFLLHRMTSYDAQTPDAQTPAKRLGRLAAFVAALDAGKGALSVALGWAAIGTPEGTMATGLAVLAGDAASRVLFRYGGSGPVSVGSLLAMAWLPGVIVVAAVPIALLGVARGLPGGLIVALAVILAPLVMALLGQAEHIHLIFAGPAAALMLLQYRQAAPRETANETTGPTSPPTLPPSPQSNT